jgi:hypothetical protein
LDKDSTDFQHARSPENSLYVTPGADDDRTYLLSWKRLPGEKEVGVLEVLNFRKISREYAVNAEQGGDYTLTFTAAPGVYHAGARAAPDTRSERAPAIHPFRRQGSDKSSPQWSSSNQSARLWRADLLTSITKQLRIGTGIV